MTARILLFLALSGWAHGQTSPATPSPSPSPTPVQVASIETAEIKGFEEYPSEVQKLIKESVTLTKKQLFYKYGSADPEQGGMDCSGTIYYVLRAVGVEDVPRTASAQYLWTRKADTFDSVISRKMDSYELKGMKPGDLLFWTGTYATDVDPPVTHSMIYLGERKKDGKQIMFGASEGRSYDGERMFGVSIFDFTIPKAQPKPTKGAAAIPSSVFIGYGSIPGLKKETTE